MDFNLVGDTAWAAKRCCLEMAAGYISGGHSRGAARCFDYRLGLACWPSAWAASTGAAAVACKAP
jgi:hypothetical protein